MRLEEVVTAPRSPWQNPFVERMIGSIRRECLDHLIVAAGFFAGLSEVAVCRYLANWITEGEPAS